MKASHPNPGRVLMTADAVGGVWTYALELARALGTHGTKVALAVMGPSPSPSQRAEAASLPNVTLYEGGYALEWMDDPWREVERAGQWLLDLADRFSPDVIHLNGYVHAALPWGRPVLVAAHSCVFSWWFAVYGELPPPQHDEYRQRVRAGLAAADLVVAPTAAMLGALEQHYGRIAQGWVIHNARDFDGFNPAPKLPKIFAAGRAWDQAKNLALLNAAAPRVGWPVSLAGDCQHPGGGSLRFANLQCLGKLPADAMRSQLAESAVYALPARYEPFGLSALEAGLCGCALVLGNVPSLREVWGDAATFVEPDDADGLVAALNRLIADNDWRREMGRRARTRALGYTLSEMAEQYLAAYRLCQEQNSLEAAA